MPKKSFKSNSSTVFIRRRKTGQIIKNNNFDKRSSKFILVDGNNEKNWGVLKAETGCKSDASFLEYLLGLAQKELNAFRQKKQGNNADNEGKIKISTKNVILKNGKKLSNGIIPPSCKTFKLQSESVELEKEKEGSNCATLLVNKENSKIKKQEITANNTNNNNSNNCNNSDDCMPNKANVRQVGSSIHVKKNDFVLVATSKSILFENSKSLAQNTKTDIAKDLVLKNDSLECKEEIENIGDTFRRFRSLDSKPESSNKKKSESRSQKQRLKDGFDEKKDSEPNKKGSDSDEILLETSKDFLNLKGKHRRKKKRDRELSLKFKKFKLKDLDESDSTVGDSLSENENNDRIKPARVAIKIKLCLLCDSRHVIGECPAREIEANNRNEKKDKMTKANSLAKTENNIYDFDESDKDAGWEGIMDNNDNDDQRWYPKKPCRAGDEQVEITERVKNEYDSTIKTISVDLTNGTNDDDDFDSDSSNSETKLRIDESFGENITFAESSLPEYLILKVSDDDHGPSVFTKITLNKGTQFGPLMGQKIKEMDVPDDFNMKDIWEVNTREGVTYLCTRDPETSNWLRYLRPAATRDSANIVSIIKETRLCFLATRDIPEGEELVYWMDDAHSAWSKKKLEKKNCGGCNLQFSHPLYYRKHCMIFHDPSCSLTIRKYHCKVCGVAVLGKEKIMKHAAELHQGKGAYQCQFCHKFFLRLNYLEMHRTYGCSKNPQRSRPLCDLCGRKFCQPQKLKVHIKRMHSDMAQVLKDFQCKSCLKILGSRAALQRHMKEVHNKDIVGACTCDRCGKMFQNKSNLKIHMLTHSGVKPFKCQQADCNAAFTTKQCLQFHYKKVHGFADGFIPKIERSIAYTFDAYSGGAVSDPGRCSSSARSEPQLESPGATERIEHRGLDLSLGLASADVCQNSKEVKSRSNGGSSPTTSVCRGLEDSEGTLGEESLEERLESNKRNRKSTFENIERDEDEQLLSSKRKKISEDHSSAKTERRANKIMVSKGSKKWLGSNPSVPGNDGTASRFKSIFRPENSDASLLVEAAISAAEKDIIDEPEEDKRASPVNGDVLMGNPAEIYSINQYMNDSSQQHQVHEPGSRKLEEYDKSASDSPKSESFQENKRTFLVNEKSNFNDILKCNTLLRINTSPLSEIPKDYNVNIVRDNETESFNDLEIHDYRSNRDLLETCKENDAFHEAYRNHQFYTSDESESYRNGEFRISSSADKFEYRDINISGECYRNLANNLEKYRTAEVYRLRSENYDLAAGYRDISDEREGEVQNLCLKEKSLQYDTLEELARIGRDNPGFECLLVGDSANPNLNQSLGVSSMPRNLHGMLSPRAYHPSPYEPESVDLSVPRPSYPSPPIYTLDLTPARLDLPGSRHVDLRNHIGLSPHRFPNGRVSVVGGNGSSPVSPTNYSVYPSPYAASATRPSPTSQFQPYASLYY